MAVDIPMPKECSLPAEGMDPPVSRMYSTADWKSRSTGGLPETACGTKEECRFPAGQECLLRVDAPLLLQKNILSYVTRLFRNKRQCRVCSGAEARDFSHG